MKNSIIQILVMLLLPIASWSQQDSSYKMTYETYLRQVLDHHPRVYQADIVQENGAASVLKAKGGFDPKLEGSIQQKYFDDKQYYSTINAGLKVPTWFGLSAKAGYDQNQGVYLNQSDRMPESGLWYAGLELELGKGLIIDQRRAELKKAKLFQQSSELERQMLRNELVLEASEAYWDWMNAYFQKDIFEEAVANAKFRLEGVIATVIMGDRPAIDTVEASIQWQNRLFGYNQAILNLENAKEKLQLYLWVDGNVPLELNNASPILPSISNMMDLFQRTLLEKDSLLLNHPYLQINELKLKQNIVDFKLKREELKPELTLKYNALNAPVNNNPITNYSMANYTWGGTLSYPILSRKARGDVKLSKLKIEDAKLNNKQLSAKVNYSINVSENKLNTAINQLALFQQTEDSYRRLYFAERDLFNIGESSLFMINSREKSFLDAQIKRIDLITKALISGNELNYQLMIPVE